MDEVAKITLDSLQNSPFFREDRTLENVIEWLNWNHEHFTPSTVFLAYFNGKLVGWLTVSLDVKSNISEMWRWVPYISPGLRTQEDDIARGLIKDCIEYVKKKGQSRLEACFDRINEKTIPLYEKYSTWFEAEEINKVDENAYMRRKLYSAEFSDLDIVFPPDYSYSPLIDADYEALYTCYNLVFNESAVHVYHDMTEKERRSDFEHYFGSQQRNESASIIVVKDSEIIGFSLVHSRLREAHIADIGIIPAHRGAGLGKTMLKHILMKAAQDYDSVTLAVDVENISAFELYSNLGFEIDYRIITHAWG
jgi:ribosomal protein S18 acetylase RimI-like enzyme